MIDNEDDEFGVSPVCFNRCLTEDHYVPGPGQGLKSQRDRPQPYEETALSIGSDGARSDRLSACRRVKGQGQVQKMEGSLPWEKPGMASQRR